MSNIANTVLFLKQNDKNYIKITDTNGRSVGKAAIYLQDVPNEDLKKLIFSNISVNTETIIRMWVELRSKNGATSRKIASYALELNVDNAIAPVVNTTLPAPIVHQAQLNNDYNGGLGIPQIIEMNRKADRYEDKCKDFDKLEKKHDETTHEKKLQDIEIIDLKTKLSTSEAQKEMAIMMAKLENKSFFDSEAFQKMLEKAPDFISAIAAIKGGGTNLAVGALGSPQSDTKAEFLEYVNDNLSDDQVNYFVGICGKMNKPNFANELQQLINRF